LCSLVGSCRCEFVYELVYIRAVLCESTSFHVSPRTSEAEVYQLPFF